MPFIPAVNFHAALKRPLVFCCWLPKDAVRHINLVGELLHQEDCYTADFILPPNPLISLAFINILGIPRWLNAIAGNLYGYISEILFRHFHRGISYVFLVTSIAHFQALTGWLVPRTFEPRVVVSMDFNMVTWQPLLAYFKTFNLLPWIVGWLLMELHIDPPLVTLV